MKRILCAFLIALAPTGLMAFESEDCLILPSREIALGATVPGLLAEVTVDRGDRVTAGQVVARLRSDVQEASLALAKTRAASPAGLKAAEARLAFEEGELQRARDLLRRRVIAQQVMDERSTAYQIRLRELEEAQANAELAVLEVALAEAELEIRRIRSPIDGVVTAREKDPGEYLRDDGSVLTVVQLDPIRVEVFLPQDRYGSVAVDDEVTIRSEVLADRSLRATVVLIDPIIDPSSATFGLRLSIPNPDLALLSGIRCTARF